MMKTKKQKAESRKQQPTTLWLLAALLTSLAAWPARADLSVQVQPGYVFRALERPTTSTLNRLGQPTITISGTVGGTNAAVAAGSLNGTHLTDTFVDGTNITWNTANPRQLKIVDGGVGVTQISTNLAGAGLAGGGGTNLYLNLDTNAASPLAVTAGMLTISNIPPSYLNVTSNYIVLGSTNDTGLAVSLEMLAWLLRTNYTAEFVTEEIPLTNGILTNAAHGLGVVPKFVRWVMVCKTNDVGYEVGDEMEAHLLNQDDLPQLGGGANETYAWVTMNTRNNKRTLDKITGEIAIITEASWRVKGYIRP